MYIMKISETSVFNTKFKSYKNHSQHEQPNVKRFLDKLAKKYSKDFSYYIIIDKHYINIYIKSKIYSSYKIINRYSFYLYNGKYR
jgi:hypothetical protein